MREHSFQIEAPHEAFEVLGIGLHLLGQERLVAAFPRCVLFGEGSVEQDAALAYCRAAQRVTVFMEVHPESGPAHMRTSLFFDQARVKVLGVCEECTTEIYEAVLSLEFAGVLPANAEVEVYRRAAAAVQRDEYWLPRRYLSRLTRRSAQGPGYLALSERETTILKLILDGCSNQQIADRLFISRETVRWHLKSLYGKLGVSDREAIRCFARNILYSSTA